MGRDVLRGLVVVVTALVAIAAWAGQGRTDDAADAAGLRLMEDLGAKPSSCPQYSTSFGAFSVQICGRIVKRERRDVDGLKRRIDASLAAVAPTEPEWKLDGKRHRRGFTIGTVPGNATLYQKSGHVVFQYPLQFDGCLSAAVDTLAAGDDGVELPLRTEVVHPIFPEQARVKRTGGAVALEVLVTAEGRADEICVQSVSRKGLGFEEAATAAMREWQWKPAKIRGIPVDASVRIVVFFELR